LPARSPGTGAAAENLKFMESLTLVAAQRFFGLLAVSCNDLPRLIGRHALLV
jgi:hypothetical protein